MIFKQIDSSVDKTKKTLALFGKGWNTYKTNWQNANGISNKIGSIFNSSNVNTSVISKDQIQILRNWNNAVTHGCTNQETFNRIIANADDNTKMYFAGLNKGKGSIEGLKNAQNIAEQSTIGLTIAQTALNMAISLGLTALISLIVKRYDELANSVENCKERVDDLISSHKSALETANNNANRVEELAVKYEKLSKGVNSLGENVSLTNEEYEEYNSLANEIAEMFPTLVQGWTDEGTAILNLKGNIEQLRGAYKEAQQEAYNLLITSGKDSDGNDIIKQWEDTHDTGFWADFLDFGADDVGGGIAVSDALKQLKAIQNMTAEEYREIERITGSGSRKEIAGLSEIEKDIGYGSYLYKALGLDSNVTDEDFRKAQRQARALIQTYNAEIESALSDVETLANAYLMTNEDYDKLDEQSKTAASMLVNSLNADIANTFSSKEDVGVYVDKIVQSILSNNKAKDALKGLFTMNTSDMSVDEIKKQTDSYINIIAEVLKEDPIKLKTRLGFDDSDTQPLITNVKEKLQDEFDGKVGELTLEELHIAAEQVEVPEGSLLSWDELIAKIKEIQGITPPTFTDIVSGVESLSTGLEQLDKIYADVLDKGDFDWSSILNNEDFKNTFGNLGQVYDDFIETISNSPNDINACQNAFNNLATAYINSSGILDNLTEETKGTTVAMLQQMGIANAEEIVTNKLAVAHEYATWAKDNEKASTENLAKATWEDIAAFYAESSASDEAKNRIVAYYLQKQLATGLTLDTSGDVLNLLALVKALGGTTTALQAYYRAKANQEYYDTKANEYESIIASTSSRLIKLPKRVVFDPVKNKYVTYDPQKEAEEYRKKAQEQAGIAQKELEASQAEIDAALANVSLNSTVEYNAPSSNSDGTSSAKETKETFNWIETALSRIQRKITNFGKTVSATWKSWTDRNAALKDQISSVNSELELQTQARARYEQQANSVALDENTKRLVREGAIDITTVDGNTAELIKEYQDWYEKILECDDAVIDLQDELANLAKTKFDNLSKQFEDQASLIEHEITMLESVSDLLETRGYMASKSIYNSLIQNNLTQKGIFQSQRNALMDNLNNSGIEKGTEAWNEMYLQVLKLDERSLEIDNNIAKLKNNLQELDWKIFDIGQEKVSNLADEADFLIELMSNDKLYNDDGSLSDQGQATLGLHAAKYNILMHQADDYAKEMQKIDAELAKDPNNQKLQEHKQELIELWRESALAAEDEKQSAKDLVSEGYDTLLDSMSKIIDKRKEMLSQVKDLYDYEKSIAEQTAEVSKYQKIINSMQGMADTEEGQAMLQKYELSLKEAKENLEETEYDKYISDQEQLLDNLYDEAEEWLNQRLDDLDAIINEVINSTNENASLIKETLEKELKEVGGTLTAEMESIWNTENGSSVISKYSEQFEDKMTTVNKTLEAIKNFVEQMAKESDKTANETLNSATPSTPAAPPAAPAQAPPAQAPAPKSITIGGQINAGGAPIYTQAGGTKGYSQYFKKDPIYTVVGEKNGYLLVRHHSLSSGYTGWFRRSDVTAYKTGGLVNETGFAWLDGTKESPEMVLNAKDTENFIALRDALSNLAQNNMFHMIHSNSKLPTLTPNAANQNVTAYNGDVHIELPNINNAQEFAEQFKEIYDKNVGKTRTMLQTDMFSKNNLEYRRYL